MEDETNQIFDKIFKRILTVSSLSVIRFINAMFERDFPLDSEILYEWTENITDKLNRTLADSIITINSNNKFHLEAQINNDKTIVFRVFDYGFQNASK